MASVSFPCVLVILQTCPYSLSEPDVSTQQDVSCPALELAIVFTNAVLI